MDNLQEFGKVTVPRLSVNPFWILRMVDLLAKSLQTKESPEAYMMYALYDRDSIRYATGKQVLTKKAANQHEILEEEVYIAEDGYIQAFLVNETEEHVWFDDFSIRNELPTIVQETHYDPWGLELTGLGFQSEDHSKNTYLYQGKEFLDDLNLNIYDFHARGYDPVIGRTWQLDPHAYKYPSMSSYSWVANNPLSVIDPTGMDTVNINNLNMQTFNPNEDVVGLGEVTVTASRINDGGGFGSNYNLGDFGTGLGLAGEGMWLLGENRSTSLYQQGFRRGLSGNYQITGRNLSLFGNQPMTSATRPLTSLTTLGKGLSNFGTGLAVAGTLVGTYQYSQGNMSGTRYSYHLTATGVSIGVAYGLGGHYGVAVGVMFFMGEKAWGMTQPIRNEISRQYWQFENALRSGWRPR